MPALFATAPKGMEALLADELRALGAEAVEERRAGAAFAGPLATAYRACLWSRTASRVLLPLATFPAPDERALYEGVRAIRWSEHVLPGRSIAVDAATSRSKIAHSHFAALKVKDAIVDQLRDERGARPSVDTARPDVRVNLYLLDDAAIISIDLSGEALHKRGWRAAGGEAPLKENLAAAVLLLAGWPARARAGEPLVDPMCGSGTLLVESALIAGDVAPGLGRDHWGFAGWGGHDAAEWARIVEEARARAAAAPAPPRIVGWDADARAVRTANDNIASAGLRGRVHVEKRALADAAPVGDRPGLVATNPPYGERIGEVAELGALYQQLGDVLRRRFTGWTAFVLVGNPALAKSIGLRAARRHVLYNGAIECRLLELPIAAEAPREAAPYWRRPRKRAPESDAFVNRMIKNHRHLKKWAKREGVTCYRVYDADLPEYAVAVDLYEGAAHLQEYAPPSTIEPERAAARLADAVAAVPEALGVDPAQVFVKVRRRQRPDAQYQRLDEQHAEREVGEGGLRFLVNLSDYLDTGLFLDHRRLRALTRELARGRDFLNLFGYTGSATVYAAAGGARTTTTVDLSRTYLDWAERNLSLNEIQLSDNRLIRADVLQWLPTERRRYGLILCAPPTFSNSKAMRDEFDLQRDHPSLLAAAGALLTDDGVLLFSNHFRRFKMAPLPGFTVEEITRNTLPPDFARNPRIHNSWRITRAEARR